MEEERVQPDHPVQVLDHLDLVAAETEPPERRAEVLQLGRHSAHPRVHQRELLQLLAAEQRGKRLERREKQLNDARRTWVLAGDLQAELLSQRHRHRPAGIGGLVVNGVAVRPPRCWLGFGAHGFRTHPLFWSCRWVRLELLACCRAPSRLACRAKRARSRAGSGRDAACRTAPYLQ